MTNTTQMQLLTAIRYLLVLAGGYLAQRGYIDNSQVEGVVSALLIIGPAAWGFFTNLCHERNARTREVVAVQAALDHAGQSVVVTPALARAIIATPVSPPNPGTTTKE